MKVCSRCKKEKPISEYIKYALYYNSMCNPCRLDYTKKNNEKIKKRKNYKLW